MRERYKLLFRTLFHRDQKIIFDQRKQLLDAEPDNVGDLRDKTLVAIPGDLILSMIVECQQGILV